MRFWVSWYHTEYLGSFGYHGPWWFTGIRESDAADTVCAAVVADSEADARAQVLAFYDSPPPDLEWRFVDQKADDWSPFGGRFERGDWMQWPEVSR